MQQEHTCFNSISNIVIRNLGLQNIITYLKYKILKKMQKYYEVMFPEI